jgi:tyrosine-protein phosphatase SIW14
LKRASTWIFVLAAAALVVLTATMYPRFEYDPDFAQKESVPGVENFARLTPQVWRGQAPDAAGIESLRDMGVKTIIDFRTTDDERENMLEYPGVEYVRMSFSASSAPSPEVVEEFLRIVTDPAKLPVFFHCRHGKDRTGAVAAVYRIRVQGWPVEKAVNEMKYFGFRTFYRDLLEFVRSQEPAEAGSQ